MKKKRLDYLDMAKGIGAILVLLGHLQGEEFFSLFPYVLPMCEWIFSFHMPLFFIVSGVLLFHRGDVNKDLKELTKKRFKGIMIPYFWFSFFYMTVVFYAFFMKTVLVDTVYQNLFYVFSTYGMNVLWFLPTIFFAEILFIYIKKKCESDKKVVGVVAVLGAVGLASAYAMTKLTYDTTLLERMHELLTALLRPLVAITFVAIGYYARMFSEKYLEATDNGVANSAFIKNKPFSAVQIKAITIISGILLMIVGAVFVKQNHGVDFRSMVYKNVFFYYLCALSSTFGLILLLKNVKPIGILKFYGINSLIFMGVHNSKTVLYYAMQLSMFANQYLTHARGYICYGIIALVILIYVAAMILIINNFVPFIVGKPISSSKIYKVDKKVKIK